LGKACSRENVFPQIAELDVNKTTAAAIIAVPLEKAIRVAIVAVNIYTVDLELEGVRDRPNQAAHPTVPDRDAFFAADRRPVIDQIGARKQLAVIHIENRRRGCGRGTSNCRDLAGDNRRRDCERKKFTTRAARFRRGHLLSPGISVYGFVSLRNRSFLPI